MFLLGPVGPMELLLIVLIVVIIFGARKLPELGKSLGEGIINFKKSVSKPDVEDKTADNSEKPSSKD
jgi:sec-independent protein translocase protein TatA